MAATDIPSLKRGISIQEKCHKYLTNYCRLVVPSPHHQETRDDAENGVGFISRNTDLQDQQPKFWTPPLTMIIFSTLQVLAFLFDVLYYNNTHDFDDDSSSLWRTLLGPAGSRFIYDPYRRREIWRFVTYPLVHAGLIHLLSNVGIQLLVSGILETSHRWWRVTIIYLAGILAGSIGATIVEPRVFLIGAAAGIYALIFACIANILMNWSFVRHACSWLLGFVLFCVVDVGSLLYRNYCLRVPDIDTIACLSGAIAGFLVGFMLLRSLSHKEHRVLRLTCTCIYFMLMGSGIFLHLLCADYFNRRNGNSVLELL